MADVFITWMEVICDLRVKLDELIERVHHQQTLTRFIRSFSPSTACEPDALECDSLPWATSDISKKRQVRYTSSKLPSGKQLLWCKYEDMKFIHWNSVWSTWLVWSSLLECYLRSGERSSRVWSQRPGHNFKVFFFHCKSSSSPNSPNLLYKNVKLKMRPSSIFFCF